MIREPLICMYVQYITTFNSGYPPRVFPMTDLQRIFVLASLLTADCNSEKKKCYLVSDYVGGYVYHDYLNACIASNSFKSLLVMWLFIIDEN